jgi:ribosomal protein S18 acetylase RimI-like enzyme
MSAARAPAGEPIPLREALRPEDADAVEGLVRATGAFTPAETALARQLVEEALTGAPGADYRFLFAEHEGALTGYTCWGPVEGTRDGFDLYWIAVEPRRQGSGLGRRLLSLTETRIAAEGGRAIWVDTSGRPDYARTRRFYEAAGYTREATLRDFYAPGDDKAIYVKRLQRGL